MTKSRGAMVADWIEKYLVHAEGDYFGRRFRLHHYPRDFVERLYVTDRSGRRVVRRALLGLPKGNGKTELAAAIGIAELAGPFAPISPLVIVAAAAFEQADLVFGAARTMINEGPLAAYFETYDTEMLPRDGKPGVMCRIAAAAERMTAPGRRASSPTSCTSGPAARSGCISSPPTASPSAATRWSSTSPPPARTLTRCSAGCSPTAASSRRAKSETTTSCSPGAPRLTSGTSTTPLSCVPPFGKPPAIEAAFLDEDRLVARFAEIPRFEFERYHLNRWVDDDEACVPAATWAVAADSEREVPAGTPIVIGFDGSATRGNTALVAATIADRPHLWLLGPLGA